jgi:hypothetical protein
VLEGERHLEVVFPDLVEEVGLMMERAGKESRGELVTRKKKEERERLTHNRSRREETAHGLGNPHELVKPDVLPFRVRCEESGGLSREDCVRESSSTSTNGEKPTV